MLHPYKIELGITEIKNPPSQSKQDLSQGLPDCESDLRFGHSVTLPPTN